MDRRIKQPRTTGATESIWSSLPGGPVTEIGGRVLAMGDVDHYVDMRAVLRSWRDAMDDPKKHQADPRFLLRLWVMLDEENNGEALFLNTDTGRFLRTVLRGIADYYFITSTAGLLVLAEKKPPHTVHVVNPLAASCIKFRAPMPADLLLHTIAHLRLAGTTPTLVLEHPSRDTAYSATPDDEHFAVRNYNMLDKAHNIWGITDGTVNGLLSSIIKDQSWEKYPCCYFLQSDGEMLLVLGRKHPARGIEVFRVNFQQKVIEPMTSIGSRAIFLGDRCVSVDADKIPSIDGNCMFYRGRGQHDGRHGIYKYDLATENEEFITSDVVELFGFTGKPVTSSMIQILVNYCTNIPGSQLARE